MLASILRPRSLAFDLATNIWTQEGLKLCEMRLEPKGFDERDGNGIARFVVSLRKGRVDYRQ